MLREMIVHSVHGWRHFLVCNTHIAFRLLRRGKKHEITCTSWSSCLWKLCELVSNILKNSSASFLCIQETYIISTISQHRHLFHSKNICPLLFRCLAIWKWLKKCAHLKCICVWCLDNWFCQASLLTHFSWQG